MTPWPQYIWIFIIAMSSGIAVSRYGELKKPDRYGLVEVLIGPALSFGLLWWGGFFAPLGW